MQTRRPGLWKVLRACKEHVGPYWRQDTPDVTVEDPPVDALCAGHLNVPSPSCLSLPVTQGLHSPSCQLTHPDLPRHIPAVTQHDLSSSTAVCPLPGVWKRKLRCYRNCCSRGPAVTTEGSSSLPARCPLPGRGSWACHGAEPPYLACRQSWASV